MKLAREPAVPRRGASLLAAQSGRSTAEIASERVSRIEMEQECQLALGVVYSQVRQVEPPNEPNDDELLQVESK